MSIATVSAAGPTPIQQSQNDACNGLDQVTGTTQSCGNNTGQKGVSSVANDIVKIISYIAGILAVIMIIVAGIRYTTSGGDAGSVSSAKTALVYALIGVAVASLAQLLIHLVLSNTNV